MPDREGRHLRPGDRVRWLYNPDKAPAVVLREVSDGYVLVTTDDGLRAELDGAELEWVADSKHSCSLGPSRSVHQHSHASVAASG